MGNTQVHEPSSEQEGVIKYQLTFKQGKTLLEDTCRKSRFASLPAVLDELNGVRTQMLAAGLIGQDDARYGGDGFGNISLRLPLGMFLISGTQTGHLFQLSEQHVALVEDFNSDQNWLLASGYCEPSSEAMTHGVAYRFNDGIQAVIHVHSPLIWQHIDTLGLPSTAADIPYGTPDMAKAMKALLKQEYESGSITLFGMKGHEDGIIAVGPRLQTCADALLKCLSQLDLS